MTIAERLPAMHAPSRRQVGLTVQVLCLIGLAALLALTLAGFAHQRGQLTDVRQIANTAQGQAKSAQAAAVANEQGLRTANTKLRKVGQATVPIPAPQPGRTGAAGPAGQNGSNGRDGISVVGPQGDTGPAGATGANGANGTDGSAGKDGANGADGATGPAGPAGADGKDGKDGKPPAGMTITWLGNTFDCTPVNDFDPNDPRYDCEPRS